MRETDKERDGGEESAASQRGETDGKRGTVKEKEMEGKYTRGETE